MPVTHTDRQIVLLTEQPRETIAISRACDLRTEDGQCAVSVHGIVVFRFPVDDNVQARFVAVQLLELGYATAEQLERLAGCNKRTLFRAREAWLRFGAAGLLAKKRGPKPSQTGPEAERAIRRLHAQGLGATAIGRRICVHPGTVRSAMKRFGLATRQQAERARQQELVPALSADEDAALPADEDAALPADEDAALPADEDTADAPAPVIEEAVVSVDEPTAADVEPGPAAPICATLDFDPDYRAIDRLLAYRGELSDAAPLFADRVGLGRVGVLLAVPLIVGSGVLEAAQRVYGDIGPAFYGLRTSLMVLLFMTLLRIRNPESLKCHNPAELGWLLGLDRAPEVKTIRRKLLHLGEEPEPTEAFLRELVQRRVETRQQALGFLYVDGHVRVYGGKTDLPKAHVARMRISLPATQEVWINDARGSPLFFVTQEAHGQLVSELPGVLSEVRELLGDNRRVTVVFDRGGWSPDLFARMDANGFDVLTYRKGKKVASVAAELFTRVEVPGSHGREHYELADTKVVVGTRRLAMRQVTRRTVNRKGKEHQTHIVTTRTDLSALQVAWRMFARWRQENFFKYMRQEFAIDALVQYGSEPADPDRDVPNPAYKAATKELCAAQAALRKLQAEYGDALAKNKEKKRRTVRGLKIAIGKEIGVPLRAAEQQVAELATARAALPKRVPIGEIRDKVVQLARSRKRLSDGLKMLAYQVETDLVALVAPHYRRTSDEGRRLVAAAMQSRGNIKVHGDEIRITLAAQSSPHRTHAIAALCAELDATETKFPGTDLRMRFDIEVPDRDRWGSL